MSVPNERSVEQMHMFLDCTGQTAGVLREMRAVSDAGLSGHHQRPLLPPGNCPLIGSVTPRGAEPTIHFAQQGCLDVFSGGSAYSPDSWYRTRALSWLPPPVRSCCTR